MKKISLVLAIAMIFTALSVFAMPASADAYDAEFLDFEAVSGGMLTGNLLPDSDFEDESCISYWDAHNQTLERVKTDKGSYLRMSDIWNPSTAFDFKVDSSTIGKGIYHFTGYFRMAYEGELTWLRFYIYDTVNNSSSSRYGAQMVNIYPTSDEWLYVDFYVELDGTFTGFRVAGGSTGNFIQSYCIDNFSLAKVTAIPGTYNPSTEGYENIQVPYFGTPVTPTQAEDSTKGSAAELRAWDADREARYDVQGIVINRDGEFLGTCKANDLNEAMFRKYADSYKDTHVTDFVLNIYDQAAAYPSNVTTDFIDLYNYNKDNNKTIPATQSNFKTVVDNNINYIEILYDAFDDLGIDFWLSYRMNDAHGKNSNSDSTFPENKRPYTFYYENYINYRRVSHPLTMHQDVSYYNNLLDYSYDVVRAQLLEIINESLDLYDCDGIELDFQREMRLWHHGGEYNGLDILTEFMREINRIVSIYETRYGHEIKVAIRCGSDIETNYDFGLDVITWAAEGLIDLVNPVSRWATTDLDIPVKMWTALMHPYGVEVAPGIEEILTSYSYASTETRHSLETIAAASANWLSQGADKIYLYNYFLAGSNPITEEHYVSTTDNTLPITGGAGHFNMLTTIGSYEKVMNMNRRMLLTYNDVTAVWKLAEGRYTNSTLPLNIYKGETKAIRIPIGDVKPDSTLEFNFSARNLDSYRPKVIINGYEATFAKAGYSASGFTKYEVLTYNVPESAYDDKYLIIEIEANSNSAYAYIEILYADVYIQTNN